MKKYIRQLVAGFLIICMILGMLLCVSLFCMSPKVMQAAVNADGSVEINEENFPGTPESSPCNCATAWRRPR